MQQGILTGLAAFRWAAWAWMATVLLLSRRALVRPSVAVALVAAALLVTAAATAALRTRPQALTRPGPVAGELALAAAIVAADGWVYGPGHVFSTAQTLGVIWPLASVLGAGVAGGAWIGAGAGLVLGGARLAAVLLNGVSSFSDDQILSLTSTVVLYVVAGAMAGHLTGLLRRAEREVASARAREEVARTLHDGVLQTLAVVERRTDDPGLRRLVRDTERRLRDYIGSRTKPAAWSGLAPALREAAARFEDTFGGRARVVVADDLPDRDYDLLLGAVGEALTNAGRHGGAREVTVFVEPSDGGVFCSVKDDGTGFDPSVTEEGTGITGSIRGRIAQAGGRVEIESRPGGPTEVRMWIA